MTVTTRFAPSPTGHLHIGNLRSALMNYLIAHKAGGTFILRLDDTDRERSKQEYADGIMRDLEWLGLRWDRVERQSDRLGRYAEAAEGLRASGRLYEVFESPTELDLKRKKQLNMGRPPVYDRAGLALTGDAAGRVRGDDGEERCAPQAWAAMGRDVEFQLAPGEAIALISGSAVLTAQVLLGYWLKIAKPKKLPIAE